MIYLVSGRIDPADIEGVSAMTVDDSIKLIRGWPVVQFDTETTGLDCHVNSLTSMQFGYKDFKTGETTAIVVDCQSVKPEEYRNVIEKSYLVGHNLKFDLKFLFNHHIVPLKMHDTMICEQVLYLGYRPGMVSFGLGEVLERNTGIAMDKSFQEEIAVKGLTPEGIVYAATDVMYLQDLRKAQLLTAESRDCVKAFVVENRAVPAMAYLEWCGVRIDVEKWREKMKSDRAELEDYRRRLDDYVRSNTKLNRQFVSSVTQPSLFELPDSALPEVFIQWSSSRQVIPVMQTLGFNTTTRDKKTKAEKESALESVISTQKGIADDFLELYYGYKGAEKNVTSYGQGHLNLINPKTGRLHTEFKQIGTVTGRMSSGSNKNNADLARLKMMLPEKVKFVNMQNLPSRGEYGKVCRACFIPEDANDFISCDYSAEESRVQADLWNEHKLLDAFENGIDTHNLYAKLCFPDELKDVDVRDVKKVRPELRQKAKSAEFAVAYGSNGASIAANIGMSIDDAMAMVQNLIQGMPGMAKFKADAVKFVASHGYIVINSTTGHRVYWPQWSQWRSVEDRLDWKFWQTYKTEHRGTGDDVEKMVMNQYKLSHEWFTKNVLNYPIQGGSAVVLKQAVADFFEWIVRNGLFGVVLFCVFAHDEICCECPKTMSGRITKVLEDIMRKASAKYYKKLPIPAEASVGDHWIH